MAVTTLLVALASCLILASAFDVSSVPTEVRQQFGQFVARYNRRYESIEEYKTRLAIFSQNLAAIDELNSRSKGANYGITKFADLSNEEFRSQYLMRNPVQPTPVEERRGKVVTNPAKVDLPASLDWRDKGAVTAVKNQEQCGSCWAFSVTENVESMWILAGKATNTTLNLAPQQIVDCDQSDGGCEGGNPPTAYEYLIDAGGLEGSKDYPYTGEDGSCNFNASDVKAKISNWKYATEFYSESELQTSLVSWGPLSICVDASNWQHYVSGVMSWEECALINILDHCVQLVGYQTQSSDGAYWIVRNSWTTSWGIDGYIWLEMGHDTCGLAHEATTSVI